MSIKNGKKPLSEKPPEAQLHLDDIFGNALSVSAELIKEITEQGLEYRWVDSKRMVDSGGYHERGWSVYKRKANATISNQEFLSGSSPTGEVRRRSVVLAVRPISVGDRHRTLLRQRTDKYNTYGKQKAAELRQFARANAIDTKVEEGYEDNE